MNYFLKFILIISIVFISACQNKDEKISIIEERDLDLQMIDAYNEGLNLLNDNYPLKAAEKFNEAELLYPQSLWAARSSLMSAYSFYYGSYYVDAIEELNRFKEIYPNHERIVYAYYLMGMCYYEQIADEKKDLGSIVDAQQNFKYVLENYPDSDFALDSQFKLELIQQILASKEMYLAKYYIEKEKWIPAINRYKNVLDKFETTIYVEEALHRLVEIHYKIGLIDESKKYAALLGYNYQSSEWYRESYKVFNKDYEKIIKKRNKKNNKVSTLEKIKSLLKNEK
ncbi:MAG: outer membrane protein assembly factor BamD [Pelagibacterales bacterium]|nr:outer membrane protein assembly factor BamD [Pelagibacterales bacterium]